MGEHRSNGIAAMNSQPKRAVPSIDIGEGYRLLGVGLVPSIDVDGNLCVLLTATGGRHSDLMPMRPVQIALTEVGKITLDMLRANFANAIKGESAPENDG